MSCPNEKTLPNDRLISITEKEYLFWKGHGLAKLESERNVGQLQNLFKEK
jgi:hypothetical protein